MEQIKREYYSVSDVRDEAPMGKASIFVKLALIVIIAVLIILSVNMLMQYGELVQQKNELSGKIDECREQIEELEYMINAPMDEDYIIRVAKDKLGLVLPEEIIFYTDMAD